MKSHQINAKPWIQGHLNCIICLVPQVYSPLSSLYLRILSQVGVNGVRSVVRYNIQNPKERFGVTVVALVHTLSQQCNTWPLCTQEVLKF